MDMKTKLQFMLIDTLRERKQKIQEQTLRLMRQKALRAANHAGVGIPEESDSFAAGAEDTEFDNLEEGSVTNSEEARHRDPFKAAEAATLRQERRRRDTTAGLDGMNFAYLEGCDNLALEPMQQREIIKKRIRNQRRETRELKLETE